MDYNGMHEDTGGPSEAREEWTSYTTSAGISFGAPDEAVPDWRDAAPAAACAAESSD